MVNCHEDFMGGGESRRKGRGRQEWGEEDAEEKEEGKRWGEKKGVRKGRKEKRRKCFSMKCAYLAILLRLACTVFLSEMKRSHPAFPFESFKSFSITSPASPRSALRLTQQSPCHSTDELKGVLGLICLEVHLLAPSLKLESFMDLNSGHLTFSHCTPPMGLTHMS